MMLELVAALLIASPPQEAAQQPPTVSVAQGLDPDLLAGPVRRTDPTSSQTSGPHRPPMTGPAITAMFLQASENWRLSCDNPEFVRQRVQLDVTLDSQGRIAAGPTFVNPQNDPVWRAAADGARRALLATAPFDVPEGFTGGRYRPTFDAVRACAQH